MGLHFILLSLLILCGLAKGSTNENQTSQSNDQNQHSMISILGLCNTEDKLLTSRAETTLMVVSGNTNYNGTGTIAYLLADVNLENINELHNDTTFHFVDENNRNSSSSTLLIPEQKIIKSEKNIPNFDCRGFNDTRDSTNIYLITTQLKYPETTKLLFIIEYESIRKAGYRQYFINIVKHAIDLIKDNENYHNKIGLVTTKKDNKFDENNDGQSNFAYVHRVFSFLLLAKNDLQQRNNDKTISEQERDNNSKAIEIIAILLKNSESDQRIAIFRYPLRNRLLLNRAEHSQQNLRREKRSYEKCNERVGEDMKIGAVGGAVVTATTFAFQIAAAGSQGAAIGTALLPGVGTAVGAAIAVFTIGLFSAGVTGATIAALGGAAEALVSKDCQE